MITTEPRMTTLFQQLGLDESEAGIADFIRDHQLAADVTIHDALLWNESQRQFLKESLAADGAWTTIVDELNEALHVDAVAAANAR